ncbi:hypothetical protein ANCDUO_09837 [Ancylostoma duodenale]|uniref:Uncharacterized protein n=1 Tax=Ancylostoma duodenale TaxID=51022 RepID=A0A0C2GSB1_9BILA|nr:hypothetical protein ANCDUO_09837 [Ancylostoma duodenale]
MEFAPAFNGLSGYVFVEREADPVLSISGSVTLDIDQHSVKVGTPMISDIQITVSQPGSGTDVTSSHVLDYCKVHLKPSRDMDLEYFSSPASLIAALQIDFEHDKETKNRLPKPFEVQKLEQWLIYP